MVRGMPTGVNMTEQADDDVYINVRRHPCKGSCRVSASGEDGVCGVDCRGLERDKSIFVLTGELSNEA